MGTMCFTMQYVKNLHFCVFCYLQRFTYLSVFAISAFALISSHKEISRKILFTILITGALIASYHVLIQYHFVKDPCNYGKQVSDIKAFENLVFNSPLPSCSKIPWKLFGISITLYNSVVLWSLSLISLLWKKDQQEDPHFIL